jgi:hypothetical protein
MFVSAGERMLTSLKAIVCVSVCLSIVIFCHTHTVQHTTVRINILHTANRRVQITLHQEGDQLTSCITADSTTMSVRPSGLPPIQDMPPPGGFSKVREIDERK